VMRRRGSRITDGSGRGGWTPWTPCSEEIVGAGAAEPRRDTSVELRRVLPVSPDEVFAAWTDPELMSQWLSPVGHAEVEVDLRVGGRFRLVMVGEDRRIEHTGEYLEIIPPSRLAFTWVSPYTGPEPTVVTIELQAAADGTELLLTHERLPRDQVEPYAGGWGRILDRLAEEVWT
jgi:uncharacterized protein YndB with AHSA1/START domain